MELIAYLVSFLSYRAVAVCLASVPLTHLAGLYWHCPKDLRRRQSLLLFPFSGGNRHVVFQLLSWALWGLSALVGLPVFGSYLSLTFFSKPLPIIPHTHVDAVSGAAAAVSFVGELFMLKAILVYDAQSPPDSPRKHVAPPHVASAAVVVMGLLLSLTGFLLLMALEYMPDVPSRVLYCCLSLSCLLIGATTSYGLGGFLRFNRSGGGGGKAGGQDAKDGGEPQQGWQFFQPFAGGTAFVTTQAIGWALFSFTIVMVIYLLQQVVSGMAYCARCLALGAGSLMVITQVILGVSLLTFRSHKTARRLLQPLLRPLSPSTPTTHSWVDLHLPIVFMYLPVHAFFTLWVLSFSFLPASWAFTGWLAYLLPYYASTTHGHPQHTGCRGWPRVQAWLTRSLEPSLTHWFGSVRVVRDADEAPDPSLRYVFGFQPHGLYPTGAGFLPLLPSFQRLLPGIRPVTLTASAMYFPPFVRDIASWSGFRQVTRRTFVHTLDERGSVMICPGGQAELVHTYRARREPREIVLHCRHKGFCKVAIEHQASLVPVLALGEALQLRNLLDLPAVQQFTYKRLGFPIPYWLVGRWGLSPLPLKVPLLYVVGTPIPPPAHPGAGTPAQQADVDALHARYCAAMEALFHKYKDQHPNYKNAKLVLATD